MSMQDRCSRRNKRTKRRKRSSSKHQEQKALDWGKVYSSHADYLSIYIMLDEMKISVVMVASSSAQICAKQDALLFTLDFESVTIFAAHCGQAAGASSVQAETLLCTSFCSFDSLARRI